MLNVEQAIAEVASVYQSLTGRPIKPRGLELPPEVDALGQAETNYRQFKSLLEQKARAPMEPQKEHRAVFAPAVDVVEMEREVRVFVDMPGVTREHVSVAIAGEVLTVRCDRLPNRAQPGVMRLEERRKGSMLRTIAMPPRARRDGIEATLRDGVLTISIPTDGSSAEPTEIPVDVK
jgi:HSP20 family protein